MLIRSKSFKIAGILLIAVLLLVSLSAPAFAKAPANQTRAAAV
ncbi:MAG: hypothetical protein V1668_03350 [Patescibacteria group bacterium]